MGIGYTIDTPLKVGHLGISSVISLVDDILIEKMREFHSHNMNVPFKAISSSIEDFRAKRITAYLDLMDKALKKKVEELKESIRKKSDAWDAYIEMLPETSELKQKCIKFWNEHSLADAKQWLLEHMPVGSIDVNIMTKLDRETFRKGQKLPAEFNDAHSALRGFANSTVKSALVLSAGMNPRLYSYLEEFEGFYPDQSGQLNKKIILKVSDYRSALIQGKFLAKKGLWVSEYRLESGLNCGGHAFATQGYLMGPILEEFRVNRSNLVTETFALYTEALKVKNRNHPEHAPEVKITAQGGVGTSAEHNFLIDTYQVDSIGWGSPFLLVPEAVSIDDATLKLLCEAGEKDLYLSNISPLGVPFNTVRGNTKDKEKNKEINDGTPGSNCTKRYASLNFEFTDKAICTASKQYQKLKIAELDQKELTFNAYLAEYKSITDKSCICVGLGTSALIANEMDTSSEGPGVSVCPGPNLAWFDREASLKEMIDHIYGRFNLIHRKGRPHMFISELKMYVDHFESLVNQLTDQSGQKQLEYLRVYLANLRSGVAYYRELSNSFRHFSAQEVKSFITGLNQQVERLDTIENKLLVPSHSI